MKTYKEILTLLLLTGMQVLWAQQEKFRLNDRNSEITVEGTSSVHDWEMQATDMNASMQLILDENNVKDITKVTFSMHSEKLKSHNSIMDKKSWDALKSDKHSTIKFNLNSVSNFSVNGRSIRGTASGSLFIAGKSNPVSIPFTGSIKSGNTIMVTGQEKINMKDFNISPPTAMMGTLKTGEEVTVKFNMEFVSESQYTQLLK